MPSAESHNDAKLALSVIPEHLLNGPRVVTVLQPDGSCIRMSFCLRRHRWHSMWIRTSGGQVTASPVPRISLVGKKAYA